MDRIIFRLSEYLFMQTAESEEYTFQTGFIVKKNSPQNLNYSYLFKNNSDIIC